MSDTMPSFTLHLPCGRCGSLFPASGEMMAELDRAGVSAEDVLERVRDGVLRWELTCPSCRSASMN